MEILDLLNLESISRESNGRTRLNLMRSPAVNVYKRDSIVKIILFFDHKHIYIYYSKNFLINKMLGRALDPHANGAWLSKLTD